MSKASAKKIQLGIEHLVSSLNEHDLKKATAQFLAFLQKNPKTTAEESLVQFVTLAQEFQGIMKVELVTARPITAKVKEKIKTIFGGEIELSETVDPGIIGGFIARTKDFVVDLSMRGKLQQLQSHLLQ